jgi:hypothetical protein
MPILDMFMLGFLVVVAIVGIAWFIYESRTEDEK